MTAETPLTTQVFRVWIKSSPGADLGRDHRPGSGTGNTDTPHPAFMSSSREVRFTRWPVRK